jgi:hypothetical protein
VQAAEAADPGKDTAMTKEQGIIDIIGLENFQWLTREFQTETRLGEFPESILRRLADIDITLRDYGCEPNAVTAIAVLTFAYRMAGKTPEARFGPKDLLLLKVLSKNELLRRQGRIHMDHELWIAPLFHLITGPVGERIRGLRMMNGPDSPAGDRFDKGGGL